MHATSIVNAFRVTTLFCVAPSRKTLRSCRMISAPARERRRMNRRSYFVLAAALSWAAGLGPQQSVGQTSVSSVVSCVSKGRERQQCSADTRAGIVMLRSTGDAACLLGRNWGYDDQGVWVSEGCGGDFGTGSSSRASAPTALGAALVKSVEEPSVMETVTTGTNPKVYPASSPMGVFAPSFPFQPTEAEVQDDATASGSISQPLDRSRLLAPRNGG